jgi:hypothetical protein
MTETTAAPGRKQAADWRRTRGGVPLSDYELDLVNQARGATPMGRYFREAVLAAAAADLGITLDEVDTERRPAPRRPNYAGGAKGKQRGTERKR